MFKKIRNIKNMAILFGSIFLIFIVGSIIYFIISNVRINNTLDEINNKIDVVYDNVR